VVHDGWIGLYEVRTLDCRLQWIPDASDPAITSATYSSDGEIIYVGFRCGSIKIVDSKTFMTLCQINLTSFTQLSTSNIRYSFLVHTSILV
jgi:periodic tryptophan protein 2